MKYAGVLVAAGTAVAGATGGVLGDANAAACAAEVVRMVNFNVADSQQQGEQTVIKAVKSAFLTKAGRVQATWAFADTLCTPALKKQVTSFLQETFDQDVLVDHWGCASDDATSSLVATFSLAPQCEDRHSRQLMSECPPTDFSEFGLVNNTFITTQPDNSTIVVACDTYTGFTCDFPGECEQKFECHDGAWTPVDVGLVRKNADDEYVGGCVPLQCDVADLDLAGNHYQVPENTPASVGFGETVLINCASGYRDLFWPAYTFQTVECMHRDSFRNSVRAYCQLQSTPISTRCPLDSGTTQVGQEVVHEDLLLRNGETATIQCAAGFEPVDTESITIPCGGPDSPRPNNPRVSLEISSLFFDMSCEPVLCNFDELDLGEAYDWSIPDSADCSEECYTVNCLANAQGPNCKLVYGESVDVTCSAGFKSSDANVTTGTITCMTSSGFQGLGGESSGLVCESSTTTGPEITTVAHVSTTPPAASTATTMKEASTPGIVTVAETTVGIVTTPVILTTPGDGPDDATTGSASSTSVAASTTDADSSTQTGVTSTVTPSDTTTFTGDVTTSTDPNATRSTVGPDDPTGPVEPTGPAETTAVADTTTSTGRNTSVGSTDPATTTNPATTADPVATTDFSETTGPTDPSATVGPTDGDTTTASTAADDQANCSDDPESCVALVSLDWDKDQCLEWFSANDLATKSQIFREAFTVVFNAYHSRDVTWQDLFNENPAVTSCGSVWAVVPVKAAEQDNFKDVFDGEGADAVIGGETLRFSLGEPSNIPPVPTTTVPPTVPPTVPTTTTNPDESVEQDFGGLGLGGLIGLIIAIVVILVIIIVVVVVVTNKKKEEEEEEEEEDDPEEEEPEEGDDNGMLSMHTEASKRLVDGIVEAQMKEQSLEEDSGEHTTSEDTGIDEFNNDSSTGAAQLIATIIHAIDDVDVPSEETTTQEDPVPVTDATNALIGEVLANSEGDSASSALTGDGADASTMDSVDPSTESSSMAGPGGRDDAYE